MNQGRGVGGWLGSATRSFLHRVSQTRVDPSPRRLHGVLLSGFGSVDDPCIFSGVLLFPCLPPMCFEAHDVGGFICSAFFVASGRLV